MIPRLGLWPSRLLLQIGADQPDCEGQSIGFHERIERLQKLNIDLRRAYELAETFLPKINELIEQLALIETGRHFLLDGEVFGELPYDSNAHGSSGQVAQAALRFPGGFGAILWDSEEFIAAQDGPDPMADAELLFVPLSACPKSLQAKLVTAALPLVDRLLRTLYGDRTP